MKKIKILSILIFILIACSLLFASCRKENETSSTPLPSESPAESSTGIIKNNTYYNDLIGMEMLLPDEWYILQRGVEKTRISGFDSTDAEAILSDGDTISVFAIQKYIESESGTANANFLFIANIRTMEDESLEVMAENAKLQLNAAREHSFRDLSDLVTDKLNVRRFEMIDPDIKNYKQVWHLILLDNYTIAILCTFEPEDDYNIMLDIISSISFQQ